MQIWRGLLYLIVEGSVEDMLELREYAPAVVVAGLDAGLRAHSLEFGLLGIGKLLGDVDHDVDQLVACATVFLIGQTLAAKAQNLARLCARRHVQASTARDSGHFHGSAECGGRNIEHQVVYHIGTVADKLGVLDFFDYHKEIAGNAAALGVVAFAAESECLAFLGASRYREAHFDIAALYTLAVAVGAALGNYLAGTVAGGANYGSTAETELCELVVLHMALAVAGRTCGECHAVLGAGALTVVAGHKSGHTQSLVDTLGDIFEREFNADTEVGTAALTTLLAPAACCAAKPPKAAEFLGETTQNIVDIHSSGAIEASGTTTSGETLRAHRVAILVVHLAFFLIAEYIVGLGRFLELLFGGLVAGIAVGMILQCKLAVCFLYLVGRGVASDAEHFIVISFISHSR